MLYCDRCANEHGYAITTEKEKGECELCHRRLGSMNVMTDLDEYVNNIATDVVKIEGLEIKQVKGFVPGTHVDKIEPGAHHKLLTDTKVLYHWADRLVIADTKSGKRVEIRF